MATIYEDLLKRKKTKRLGKELDARLNLKLTQILKDTCNIDLSSMVQPFKQWHYIDLHNLSPHALLVVMNDGTINVDFHFEGGSASMYLYPNQNLLTLRFHFQRFKRNEFDAIFFYDAKSCIVKIDHDMNIIKTNLNVSFSFLKSSSTNWVVDTTYDPIIIDFNESNKNSESQFVYGKNLDGMLLKKLSEHGLDPFFLVADESFKRLLSRFMSANSIHSVLFYEEFKEYISSNCLLSSTYLMVCFLNMFLEDYKNDVYSLTSRLMLIEMSTI